MLTNIFQELFSRITSYNVCYTKLLRNIAVPPEFKSPELQKSKVFPVFETIATTVEPMIPQSVLDGITGKKEHVITSYSIHYTKLYDGRIFCY